MSSGVALPFASRLDARVPANKTGSCGIIARLSRSCFIDIDRISIPSISIVPSDSISTIRNRVRSRLLFPDPVRPTTPKVLPGGTERVTPFNTNGADGLYFIETFLNEIPPFHGQPSDWSALSERGLALKFSFEGFFSASPAPSISLGISDSMSVISVTRCTLIICDSSMVRFLTAHAINPVIARDCVNPHPAEPDCRRPARAKNTELTAVMKTILLPIASRVMDSHRSSAFTVEKTDRFTSANFRCRDDHVYFAPGMERMTSVPRRASPKCVKIGALVRCSLRFMSRAAGRNRLITRTYRLPANANGMTMAGEITPDSANAVLNVCNAQ
mmetsp:Transcript_19660/g.40463  ORF Transcript_19660/g.40463 Transcript_19660/m.40463 type:complete len:330 (+) Transcript_19660:480-1469(+)